MKPAARIILITAASFIGGGIFYALWLVVYLLIWNLYGDSRVSILWTIAPVITALGFTTGQSFSHHLLKIARSPFPKMYLWSLAGCVLGAVALYWFGHMLIVFSMLAAGALSVFLFEIKLVREK